MQRIGAIENSSRPLNKNLDIAGRFKDVGDDVRAIEQVLKVVQEEEHPLPT